MFKPAYSNPELNRYIKNVCRTQNINTVKAVPISVDSVMCEYQHLDEFKNMAANVIEMETATFFNISKSSVQRLVKKYEGEDKERVEELLRKNVEESRFKEKHEL